MRRIRALGAAAALACCGIAAAQGPVSSPKEQSDSEAHMRQALQDLAYLHMAAGMCGHRLPDSELAGLEITLQTLPPEAQKILRNAQVEGRKMQKQTPLRPTECDRLLLQAQLEVRLRRYRSPQRP